MEHNKKEETLFEKHRENVYFRWGLTAFIVVAACIVLSQLVYRLPAFVSVVGNVLDSLAPLLYGLIIAYLLDPIVERVAKLLKPQLKKAVKKEESAVTLSRAIGVLVGLVFAVLLLWALIAMILPQLTESIVTIWGNLPAYYETLSGWVNGLIDHNDAFAALADTFMDNAYSWVENFIKNTIMPKIDTIIATLTSSVWGVAMSLLDLVIGIIISVYLLMGKNKFLSQGKKIIYALLGRKKGGYLCNVCTFANHAFGGFIGGKIIDSAIIGVLCFIGTSLLQMPYALLISIIVGVTNVIPFFGPYLGAIPSALLLLVIDPVSCVIFVIFIFVLQQLDGNVIGPLILGDATGLSSIWVVVAILFFGGIWGIPGMIVAVPLFAVIYQIGKDIINRLAEKRGLSTDSGDYEDWNYPPRHTDGAFHIEGKKKGTFFRKKKAKPEENPEGDTKDS